MKFNNFRKLVTGLFTLFIAFNVSVSSVQAQDANSLLSKYANEKASLEIGAISVNGAVNTDGNAIVSISGLKVGDKITIPGAELTKAIKALWKLSLFSDIQIIEEKRQGDVVFLAINVQERPRFSRHVIQGAKKSYHEDINKLISGRLVKGTIVKENTKIELKNDIEKFFKDKGFTDAKCKIEEATDESATNSVRLIFDIQRNERVKIKEISFTGNNNVKAATLRKKMDKTRQKSRLFASSKLIDKEYEDDKKDVIKYYNKVGFRDARILGDSVWRSNGDEGDLMINLKVHEGNRYYFRNISWKGNSIYETDMLTQVLGIKKGDVYNQELLDNRLKFSQDGRDISSLYMDNGYLFFNIDPLEIAVDKDSIDLELRMFEGPQATIDKVVIKGNDRTHEHVIRRELRTRPGDKFSRTDIIRSQREIVNLGYFNQEKLGINTPVNAQRGTVDIEYTVEEKPSDQLELSAGWGGGLQGGGIIGTLGVSFNNFSIRNILNKSAWSPLPQGDGQRLSIRFQSNGKYYQSFNTSFTEPWLGGKKPQSLTIAGNYTKLDYTVYNQGKLGIAGVTASLGTRLKVPDDNFIFSTALGYQNINSNNFGGAGSVSVQLPTGVFNDLNLKLSLARNSINDPLFPKSGSNFSLTAQFSPPYSLFKGAGTNYADQTVQERFRWVEYHKWRFSSEWYATLVGKLVLKTSVKMGLLGYYNKNVGLSPFNRFQVGGSGLNNQSFTFTGVEIISSRGYEQTDLRTGTTNTGTTVFNKYAVELRYPISLNPSSTIFVLGFAEGINTVAKLRDYNPFQLRRSAGLGLRVFLPMFGMLGFDYGIGFDKPAKIASGAKWTEFGQFNIILGFEPD